MSFPSYVILVEEYFEQFSGCVVQRQGSQAFVTLGVWKVAHSSGGSQKCFTKDFMAVICPCLRGLRRLYWGYLQLCWFPLSAASLEIISKRTINAREWFHSKFIQQFHPAVSIIISLISLKCWLKLGKLARDGCFKMQQEKLRTTITTKPHLSERQIPG